MASLPSDPSAAASTVSGEIPTAEAEVGPLAAEEPDRQQAGEQLRQRHGQPHAVHLQQPGQQKQLAIFAKAKNSVFTFPASPLRAAGHSVSAF